MRKNYNLSTFPRIGKYHIKKTSDRAKDVSCFQKRNIFQKMMGSLAIFLAIGLGFNSHAQIGTIQIGSGTATTTAGSTVIPITNYNYAYSQQLITAAEYAMGGGAVGNITKIRYYFATVPTLANWEDWTVYIGNTTQTSFASTTDWLPAASMDQVFSGAIAPVAGNWYEITFSTPFNYTGGNIIVAIHENSPGWLGGPALRTYTSATNSGILYRDDTIDPDPNTPPTATSRTATLPQLQFEGTLSSCPPPNTLNLSALTDNSATLTWSEAGTATSWDVEYGPVGFTPTGTPTNPAVANPFILNGLTSNTAYSYYVRSSCGPTETSAWVGPFNFTTPCVAANIPFFEGFETGYTHNTDVAGCWTQELPNGTKKWKANNTLTSNNRAPRTGGWDATLEYSGESWMFQGINLVVGTNYMIKFYARQDATTVGGATISAHFGMAPNAASMSFVAVPTTNLTNGNYQEMIGYFTPTTTDVYYFGIHGTKTSANWYITLDDISVDVAPTCASPNQLTATNVTATGAQLAWLENGTATSWDVEYGTAGFTPTGTATVAGTTNPTLLTGLTPSTTYEYYVRAVCSVTDNSAWTGPYSFTTPCLPASIPFFEGFETGYTHNVDLAGCWSQELPNGTKKWRVNNTFTTNNRAPRTGAWDATLEYSGESWMFQGISLVAGTNYEVKFYARQDANNAGGATISAHFGMAADAASMSFVVVPTTDLTNGNYQEMIGYFTPTTTDVYYLGIHGMKTSANWYITLDDISVDLAPSCPAPDQLAVGNLTGTSADLSWVENGTASDWDVEFGPAGFTPTGTPTNPATTNPAPITGLNPSTSYDYYVRSACSPTDQSTWAGPFTFTTLQIAATLPYTDDFSTSQWSFVNGTQPNKWFIGSAAGNPADGMYISNDNGVTNAYTSSVSVTHAYRDVDFPAGGNTFNLSFDWKAYGEGFASFKYDYFRVWVVPSSATLTAGTQITTANTPGAYQLGDHFNNETSWVQNESFVIPQTFSGTTSRLVFEWRNDGSTANQTPAAIDNVNISEISCSAPTTLTATAITTTSADLGWTEIGSSSDWVIQYGLSGFNLNSGTIVPTSTNPHPLTGLQPSTSYSFYVASLCGVGDSSTWSGPFTFATDCAPITTLPWTENFDNMPALGAVFPPCWVDEDPGDWETSATVASTTTAGPLSGSNYLRINYSSDATMWTPEFDLVAGETYEFSFNWAGDTRTAWDGGAYVNTTPTFTGATLLGTKFVENGDATSLTYQPETYCFTPTTTGTYSFGIKVVVTSAPYWMSFDDFSLEQVVTTPGVDGALSVCATGSPVDLNTVITTAATDGTWSFGLNPTAVNSAGMLNASTVPAGVHEFFYITDGCAPDTTVATITIVKPSSAGNDGALAVCRNEPFNLLAGLGGNVDFGGVWTDPNSVVVPNGNATSGNIPGQFNYTYIVSNGTCPADTAKVVVNVQGCDYTVGLEEIAFEGFNMYPNPTSDFVFISNTGSTEVFNYEVLDMNGRVILKANQAINGSTTTELNLSKVEVGIYMIRVFNEHAEKTFRILKN